MVMKKPVIFLGPSMPISEAQQILDADYRPPVKRGDVHDTARDSPPLIGIIDGVFLTTLPPSPLEVLEALRAGVPIMGSASLGALRAVELEAHGMVGVGRIFRMYRCRQLVADDEVALVFSPEDFRPLSEPLVNMRYALSEAVRARIIDPAQRRTLVMIAKGTYFPRRSWSVLYEEAREHISDASLDRLARFVRDGDFNLKKKDAMALLIAAGKFMRRHGRH